MLAEVSGQQIPACNSTIAHLISSTVYMYLGILEGSIFRGLNVPWGGFSRFKALTKIYYPQKFVVLVNLMQMPQNGHSRGNVRESTGLDQKKGNYHVQYAPEEGKTGTVKAICFERFQEGIVRAELWHSAWYYLSWI